MIQIKIEAQFESGATIVLTNGQKETLAKFAEDLILNNKNQTTPHSTVISKPKKKRKWSPAMPWTDEENYELLKIIDMPFHSKQKSEAKKEMARKYGRTVAAIETRIWNFQKGKLNK